MFAPRFNAFNIPTTQLNKRLQRVDNSLWEAAQAGVEYYCNDQYGGIHGTIYVRFYEIPDSPGSGQTVYIPLGFSWGGNYYTVRISGVAIAQGGGSYLPLPFVDFGSANRNLELIVEPPNIKMAGGSGQDWQAGGFVQLDYKK